MIYYISDTHFYHDNIRKYCQRPFDNTHHMNATMARNIRSVDTAQNRLIHCGDFTFRPKALHETFGELMYPEHNTLILGNHDRLRSPAEIRIVQTWFHTLIGTHKLWRTNSLVVEDKLPSGPVKVLVTHLPAQPREMGDFDYNVYGHFHNNLFLQPEREVDWLWVLRDSRYLNAGVEITEYMPQTLAQLIQSNEEAVTRAW